MFERSKRAIPGGVNSSIRAFKAVGGEPYVVARAAGATITDVEGTTYFDLVQSYGAIILGHAHPAVTAALRAAAGDGTSYGAPTPREMKLAEAISERVPSCERVRLMNSGTEATSTAVRLARGVTGRDRIVTFAGNFHGATDALLVAGGSGVATLGLPGTAGVPRAAVSETLVVPYNVVPQLDEQVAAVIVEPIAANMGVVAPVAGFLDGLRAECDRVGALLIFDEVITGFRIGPGGAQAKYDVRPDITCFGKVIGGGLPIGAIGGRVDIMEHLSPLGPVFHAGTLAGNPMATAAGLAAFDQLTGDVYIELMARVRHLSSLLRDACGSAGLIASVPGGRHAVRDRVRRRIRRCHELRRGQTHRRGDVRRLLPGDVGRGRGDGAGRVRGDLRRAGARRCGDHVDRRGGAPGCPRPLRVGSPVRSLSR